LVHNTFILFLIYGYDLVQYPHIVDIMVADPNAIPSLVVLDLTPQKVPLPIQDESGNVSEWAHKSLRWFCKVDACTSSYVAKWMLCQDLEQTHSFRMQAGKSRRPSTHLGGLGNKITVL
jgi:hypothetical protein